MSITYTPAPKSADCAADWGTYVIAPLTEDELKNKKFTSTKRVAFYSKNAKSYDADMTKYSYRGPNVAAQALHDLIKDKPDSHILDIGCGTGRVAEALLALGPYTNIDGLEPADGMADIAEKKNIYQNIMRKYLYLDCGLEHDAYDSVISSGTFMAGHMKSDCLIELCNALKSGGYLVIALRREYMDMVEEYRLNLRPTVDQLVKEGRWKMVKDEICPDWCFGKDGKGVDGQLFVFQKC